MRQLDMALARRPVAAPAKKATTPTRVTQPMPQGGQPLAPGIRSQMEAGFGQGLGQVRLHDDAAAHDSARRLNARAYTAGNHAVMGAGQYDAQSPASRGVIAHAIAHVLQNRDPVAALTPVSKASEAALEADAEQASRALSQGQMGRVRASMARPGILRAGNSAPAPVAPGLTAQTANPVTAASATTAPALATPTPAPPAAAPALKLPPGMEVVEDEPMGIGTTRLVVSLASFTLPAPIGSGDWVQKAYDDGGGSGGKLVFNPIFNGQSVTGYDRIAATKEGSENYKKIWLNKFGFTTTQGLAAAYEVAVKANPTDPDLTDPGVKTLMTGMKTNLQASGGDIDHIVEKQIGGTSMPSNLQVLTSHINQISGTQTYAALVDLVKQIRDPSYRGPGVFKRQIQLRKVVVPAGANDASVKVEALLRGKTKLAGNAKVAAAAVGKPVHLSAGGQGETLEIAGTGESDIQLAGKRIVAGMKLRKYQRGAAGVASPKDTVEGVLDNGVIQDVPGKSRPIVLEARLAPTAAPGAAATPDPAAGATATPVAGERRVLKLAAGGKSAIPFYYPCLSPGEMTKVTLDGDGNIAGEGFINASLPMLGKLHVAFSKDTLKLVGDLGPDRLVSSLPSAFRFTGGKLALQLAPTLEPSGSVQFTIGPAARPVLKGDLTVAYQNGAVQASGTLMPGDKLRGISAAEGRVIWNSETGWAGKITASIPRMDANVEVGFSGHGKEFKPYASGSLTTKVRSATLELGAAWHGRSLNYYGHVIGPDPLPMVKSVRLDGNYDETGISLSGQADIVWKNIGGKMKVDYAQNDHEDHGRFSGSATLAIKTEKAEGSVTLSYSPQGVLTGKGEVSYQVTKTLRPKLGIELDDKERIKLMGTVAVGDIALSKMWPWPDGGKIDFITGLGVKFDIPTPMPAVTAYGEIRGSLGLGYGVGPVMLRGVLFTGELYPLEDDPQIKAHLSGAFVVPAYGELFGTFGAHIGLEVALGAVGAKGGIEIKPTQRIAGEGGIKLEADYDKDGFSFEAEAYAKGALTASARVDLVADLYAAWGLFSHRWTLRSRRCRRGSGRRLR